MSKRIFSILFVIPVLLGIFASTAHAANTINWNTAIKYAKLTEIAENVSSTKDYSSTDKAAISALGYTYLQTLWGSDLGTTDTPDAGVTVSYGFLAVSSSGELVAAIRGTDSILEWIDDAQFYFVTNPVSHSLGLTEEGFTAIYKSLRIGSAASSTTAINSVKSYITAGTAKSVTVTGHSLGAALGTLLALDVAHNTTITSPTLYTFASPRVGEEFFALDFNEHVTDSYRVYIASDVVPDMPLWPYTAVKTGYSLTLDSSKVKTGIVCSHHLTTYLWEMGQVTGTSAGTLESSCVVN